MKIRRSIRRAIAWVVAITVLAQIMACSYVPTRPNERSCAQEKAEVVASAKDLERDQQAIFFNVMVDGRWTCAAAVPKDEYFARLFVTWSDGKAEEWGDFYINVEPGRQYSVLAYEAGVGHVPTTATLTVRQAPSTGGGSGGNFGNAGAPVGLVLLAVVIVVILVAAPFVITSKIIESKQAEAKKARLAMNCCYVWIEDAKTHETIAGIAPSAQ